MEFFLANETQLATFDASLARGIMSDSSRKSHRNLYTAIIMVALTFVLYSQTLKFDFVNWDDDVYLYENIRVQSPTIENIRWFFANPYYHAYIPLTMISHMIDFTLWGFNPSGHHLTSVILHSLNAFWVLVLSLQLFSIAKNGLEIRGLRKVLRREIDVGILFPSILAALLCVWHPLRAESVAWVSDRKDLLCAFFLFPVFIAYINYVAAKGKSDGRRWYLASLTFFVFACLSKSVAVTAPAVFLLMDYVLLNRLQGGETMKRLLTEKIPFFIVTGAVALVAAKITPDASSSDMFEVLTPMQRAFLPFYNSIFYLGKTFLPTNLSPMYPLANEGAMMVAFIMFATVSVFCLWLWKKGMKVPLLAWLCYVIMLAPSSSFSSTIIQTTADRYSYLPSVALFLLFGGSVGEAWERFSSNKTNQIAIACTALLVVGFLGFTNFRQQKIWMNSETLWGRAIDLYPSMPLPYNNFGLALQARGELGKAAEAYTRAIQLKPNYLEAHLNLGNIMFAKGNWDEAERLFRRAAELNPNQAEVYNNLGVVSITKGNTLEALRWFRKSIEVNPEYAQGYFNLAALYAKMGNNEASVEALKKAAHLGHYVARESLRREGISR